MRKKYEERYSKLTGKSLTNFIKRKLYPKMTVYMYYQRFAIFLICCVVACILFLIFFNPNEQQINVIVWSVLILLAGIVYFFLLSKFSKGKISYLEILLPYIGNIEFYGNSKNSKSKNKKSSKDEMSNTIRAILIDNHLFEDESVVTKNNVKGVMLRVKTKNLSYVFCPFSITQTVQKKLDVRAIRGKIDPSMVDSSGEFYYDEVSVFDGRLLIFDTPLKFNKGLLDEYCVKGLLPIQGTAQKDKKSYIVQYGVFELPKVTEINQLNLYKIADKLIRRIIEAMDIVEQTYEAFNPENH